MSMSALASGNPTDPKPDDGTATKPTVSDVPIYDEVAAEHGDPRAGR